jgi:PAS domain S-box-containing protein
MNSPLRILYLEDDPRDAELVQETLEAEGLPCVVTRVESEGAFLAALKGGAFEMIFADYTLPSYDGLSALKVARRECPDVPFLFVSGTLGEEVAIEALKIGAIDYVFKTRLFRLAPSVQRALRETQEKLELSRSEAALRTSQTYLAEAQRLTRTGSFGWHVSTSRIYWSEETFRIFEFDPSTQPTQAQLIQRIHPEDRKLVQERLDSAAEQRKDFDVEHRLLMPDGSVKYLRVVGHPAKEDQSGGFEYIGVVSDITERKRGQEEIGKLASLVENSTDFIGIASLQGEVLFLNAAAQATVGLAGKHQVERTKILDYNAAHDRDRFENEILPIVFREGRWEGETFFKHFKTGATIPMWQHIFFITEEGNGRRLALATICRDMTERRRVQEALQRSERSFRQVIETMPSIAWTALPDGTNDFVNDRWIEFTGLSLQETAGDSWRAAFHPADVEAQQQKWLASVATGKPFDNEARLRRASDLQYHWFLHRAVPLRDERGEIVKWYGTGTDIEDSKRTEEALRRGEAYLAEAQKLSHTGSWAVDARTMRNIYWSREMYRIFDLEQAATPPSYAEVGRYLHLDDVRYHAVVEQAVRNKTDFETDYRLVPPGAPIKYIHVIGHPVLDAAGEVVELVGTAMDVTQQQEARMALETAFAEIKTLKDQLLKENIVLREEVDKASMFEEILGDSPALRAVLARVAKVAPTDSTVLITGETGTGKELIARAIHRRSSRGSRAFVSVNCAAIPAPLIASELLGHEKGAFTGALQRRLGRFELAEGGTIFLDEVGELPLDTQTALLRVLQEREFERVGGSQTIKADVRVIAATNRDLQGAIADDTFRSDLFYRLNVFPIHIPSLRERKEDVPMLVEYFIDRYSRRAGKRIASMAPGTLDLLRSYAWPGNIRELQNIIERSVIVCETDSFSVDPSWLSVEAPVLVPPTRGPVSTERATIEAALAATGGRIAGPFGAAARLGMPASTLESKIRSLKINKFRYKAG